MSKIQVDKNLQSDADALGQGEFLERELKIFLEEDCEDTIVNTELPNPNSK